MNKAFLLLAIIFAIIIAAAAVPSPLYAIFQHEWHFSAITLTVIFAVYAIALLIALLFVGSLSDYIGRRPVLIGSLVLEAISMVLFIFATGVVWLILARIVQGFATGIASSVLSAALIDTQPKDNPSLAPLVSTVVPVGGVGLGAILSSLFVEYLAWPTHLIFLIVFIASIVTAFCCIFMNETTAYKPGWLKALIPVVFLPDGAKEPLLKVGASLIAVWALVGLYLSLGPSIVMDLIHSHNYLSGGLIILTLTTAGVIASVILRAKKDNQLITIGTIASSIGLTITVYSIASANLFLLFLGTAVAGIGFGPSFTGSFRSIMSRAPGDERAGLASIVYIISYLALSVPVVIAGFATANIGLHTTVLIYCISVLILYLLTLILSRTHRI